MIASRKGTPCNARCSACVLPLRSGAPVQAGYGRISKLVANGQCSGLCTVFRWLGLGWKWLEWADHFSPDQLVYIIGCRWSPSPSPIRSCHLGFPLTSRLPQTLASPPPLRSRAPAALKLAPSHRSSPIRRSHTRPLLSDLPQLPPSGSEPRIGPLASAVAYVGPSHRSSRILRLRPRPLHLPHPPPPTPSVSLRRIPARAHPSDPPVSKSVLDVVFPLPHGPTARNASTSQTSGSESGAGRKHASQATRRRRTRRRGGNGDGERFHSDVHEPFLW